jgi:hypothetical protein
MVACRIDYPTDYTGTGGIISFGDGGTGGALGQAGSKGQTSTYGSPSNGGPAGNYARGTAFITWATVGSRLGSATAALPSGQSSTQIQSVEPLMPDTILLFFAPPSNVRNNITSFQEVDISRHVTGLKWSRFSEYRDDPKALLANRRQENRTLSDQTTLDNRNWAAGLGHHFSLEIRGYIRPTTTGMHTFTLCSDDGSHMWIGQHAIGGATGSGTTSNAFIKNGGFHGNTCRSNSIYLTAGVQYPIWAIMWEHTGARNFNLSCNRTVQTFYIGDGWK